MVVAKVSGSCRCKEMERGESGVGGTDEMARRQLAILTAGCLLSMRNGGRAAIGNTDRTDVVVGWHNQQQMKVVGSCKG